MGVKWRSPLAERSAIVTTARAAIYYWTLCIGDYMATSSVRSGIVEERV